MIDSEQGALLLSISSKELADTFKFTPRSDITAFEVCELFEVFNIRFSFTSEMMETINAKSHLLRHMTKGV